MRGDPMAGGTEDAGTATTDSAAGRGGDRRPADAPGTDAPDPAGGTGGDGDVPFERRPEVQAAALDDTTGPPPEDDRETQDDGLSPRFQQPETD